MSSTTHTVDTTTGRPIFDITYHVDGRPFNVRWDSARPLLSANSKLKKLPGRAGRYRAIGLAMAPANYSGRELCAWRTIGCTMSCNGFWSGMNVTSSTRAALIGRALLWHNFRPLFVDKLYRELENFSKLCKRTNVIPAVRLNVSTDIVWERMLPELFADFPAVRFYDYTKALPKHRPTLPANYNLSHSWSESTSFADVGEILSAGRNLVVAFDSAYAPQRKLWGALPEVLRVHGPDGRGYAMGVVDGDSHDLRLPELDGRGVVVGLHGKSGRQRVDGAVLAGFMLHHAEGAELRPSTEFRGVVDVCR